ncbi:MAG: hypothetical protein V7724_06720 [Sediminicola sp.]
MFKSFWPLTPDMDELATTVNGQHEGIISEDLFHTVQNVIDGRNTDYQVPNGSLR